MIVWLSSTLIVPMVLILDGYLEKGAYVKSNLCYLICLRHSVRTRAVTNWIFFTRKAKCVNYKFSNTIWYKYHDCSSMYIKIFEDARKKFLLKENAFSKFSNRSRISDTPILIRLRLFFSTFIRIRNTAIFSLFRKAAIIFLVVRPLRP